MTDRVPRIPLPEIRQLVQDFGLSAVEEALQNVRNETFNGTNGKYGTSNCGNENGSLGSASTEGNDFDKYRIQEAMLEASFDPNFAVNQKGIIRHVNQAAVRQFGYDRKEELIGENIKIIVGGGHAAFHDQYLATFRETREKHLIGSLREVSGRRKDGSEFPCVIGLEVIESHTRQDKLLYFASIRDVTKEKQIQQQQLVRSAILDASFDAMFAIDLEGTIKMVNKVSLTAFGYHSEEELVGENIKMIVGGGHTDKHDSYLKRYKETGEARLIGSLREVSARRKDGSEFPCVIGLERVESEQDVLMVGFVRDITKQKEAERLQMQSQRDEKIRSAILDAAFDSMFAIDLHGTIKMVNKAAVGVFGYQDSEEFIGKNIKMIVGGGHARHHDGYLRNYRETGETTIIGSMREVMARKKNGDEFPVILGIERLEEEELEDPLLIAFVRDITEQKKATAMEIDIRAAEELLCNMLPEEIADRLKLDPHHLADHHEEATILFADIVGFTAMSSNMTPGELVEVLNDLFTRFDQLVDQYGLNKVKTIGDCYMVTSIPSYRNPEDAAGAMCHFSLDMVQALKQFNTENPANNLDLRVGINTGSVVAGVVGTSRFLYDLWGDAVNVASRMESTGIPSRVQVTKSVLDSIEKDAFVVESRGQIQVKGKGLIEAFLLEKRLQPRDKYLAPRVIDVQDLEPTPETKAFRESFRRRSTHNLQGALLALQSQLGASFRSPLRMPSCRSFSAMSNNTISEKSKG